MSEFPLSTHQHLFLQAVVAHQLPLMGQPVQVIIQSSPQQDVGPAAPYTCSVAPLPCSANLKVSPAFAKFKRHIIDVPHSTHCASHYSLRGESPPLKSRSISPATAHVAPSLFPLTPLVCLISLTASPTCHYVSCNLCAYSRSRGCLKFYVSLYLSLPPLCRLWRGACCPALQVMMQAHHMAHLYCFHLWPPCFIHEYSRWCCLIGTPPPACCWHACSSLTSVAAAFCVTGFRHCSLCVCFSHFPEK